MLSWTFAIWPKADLMRKFRYEVISDSKVKGRAEDIKADRALCRRASYQPLKILPQTGPSSTFTISNMRFFTTIFSALLIGLVAASPVAAGGDVVPLSEFVPNGNNDFQLKSGTLGKIAIIIIKVYRDELTRYRQYVNVNS
jgi:hypothetical protein